MQVIKKPNQTLKVEGVFKNETLPLVSVITPTYNRAPFLDETIQSVLAQDYSNIEFIILDDGSTDNTQEVLEKYKACIISETHTNMGETRTVNKGFSMAKGDIICVVNSDDPIYPGAIKTVVNFMLEHPKVLAVYPDWDEIDVNSRLLKRIKLSNYTTRKIFLEFNVGIGPCTFFRRKIFDLIGMRDPNLKYTGDLDFWFRIFKLGDDCIIHIPKTLGTHRTHPGAASSLAKGADMAEELVTIVHKFFSCSNIPSDIIRLQKKALSNAHYHAIYYCGLNIQEAKKHYILAIKYNPFKFFLIPYLFIKMIKFLLKKSKK